jgi:transcriptional antiterminator NusG
MSTLSESPEPQPITALSNVRPDEPKKAPPRRRRDDAEEEQEQLTEEEINASGRKWYFVHTYSGHENKVRSAVKATVDRMDAKDRVFHVVVPTEDEIEIRDGQRRTVKRKLYPGYVLVQTIELGLGEGADPDDRRTADETWHMIRNTTGVTGFVSSGDRPVPLSTDEVNHILRAMRMEQPRVRIAFMPGQNVRIVDGPFEDFVGTVEEINTEKGKVRVLVNMFGRETPVELDFLQVEKL